MGTQTNSSKKNNKKTLIIIIIILIIISIGTYLFYIKNNENKIVNNLATENLKNSQNIKKNKNSEIKLKSHKIKIEKNEKKQELKEKNNINKNIFITSETIGFFRNGDRTKIKATIFNNTDKEKLLKIKFKSDDIEVNKTIKNLTVGPNSSEKISFWVKNGIDKNKDIKYLLFALGDSKENSAVIEKKIIFKQHPSLNPKFVKGGIAKKGIKQNFKIDIPENTDMLKSKVKISFSHNLAEINKEIGKYLNNAPYGKIASNLEKDLYSFKKSNGISKFAFSIGTIQNREKRFFIGGNNPQTIAREFILDDNVQYKEDYIELTTYILSGNDIFTNLTLDIIPKDKFKIKAISNGVKINREIFEISDKNKIIKKIKDGKFELGKKYKIIINIVFDSKENKKNIILEDYIPSTFKIIDSQNFGFWDSIKYFQDKIFVQINKFGGKNLKFEYIITPNFVGEYTFPPAVVYLKDNYDIKANNKFEKIEVK